MGDLKGVPAVHFNFLLNSFSLYLTFKSRIAAAGEPIPSEYGRFGECKATLWNRSVPFTTFVTYLIHLIFVIMLYLKAILVA